MTSWQDKSAAGRLTPAGKDCPPDAATSEGRCIAVRANAAATYQQTGRYDKALPMPPKSPLGRQGGSGRRKAPRTAFRGSTGQIWAFGGKCGRVLAMLAKCREGITPFDCWPWHTRLGASVHVLRKAGLTVRTEREGDCNHARYFLMTAGHLVQPADGNGEAAQQWPETS